MTRSEGYLRTLAQTSILRPEEPKQRGRRIKLYTFDDDGLNMRVLAFVAVLAAVTVPAYLFSQHHAVGHRGAQPAWPKNTACGEFTRHDGSVIHFVLSGAPEHDLPGPCPLTAAYIVTDSS